MEIIVNNCGTPKNYHERYTFYTYVSNITSMVSNNSTQIKYSTAMHDTTSSYTTQPAQQICHSANKADTQIAKIE
jgi:hypothetical protein